MSDANMDEAVKALRDMAAGDFVDSRRRLHMAKTLLPKVEALAKREAVPEVVAYRIHIPHVGVSLTASGTEYETAKLCGHKVEWLAVVGGIAARGGGIIERKQGRSIEVCVSCGKPWTGEKCADGDPADPCMSESQAKSLLAAAKEEKP